MPSLSPPTLNNTNQQPPPYSLFLSLFSYISIEATATTTITITTKLPRGNNQEGKRSIYLHIYYTHYLYLYIQYIHIRNLPPPPLSLSFYYIHIYISCDRRTISLTFFLYATLSFLHMIAASIFAGDESLGSFNIDITERIICSTPSTGLQRSSAVSWVLNSSTPGGWRIEMQTLPSG